MCARLTLAVNTLKFTDIFNVLTASVNLIGISVCQHFEQAIIDVIDFASYFVWAQYP